MKITINVPLAASILFVVVGWLVFAICKAVEQPLGRIDELKFFGVAIFCFACAAAFALMELCSK